MKTRIIVCLLLGASLACCPGQSNTNGATVDDPVFRGKPLSAWMEAGYKSDRKTGPEWQAAGDAVFSSGTNAVPLLLRWLAAKDAPTNHFDAAFRNRAAEAAFGSLAAIEANTQKPLFDLRFAAPAVVDIYRQNVSLSSRSAACAVLYYFGSAIDPAAKSAIPQLCQDATNQETLIGYNALRALGNMRSESAVVVPYLAKLLQDSADTDSGTQMGAMQALGNLGPNARPAIPALRAFAKRPNIMFGDMANEAIKKIDPDGTAPTRPD